MKGDICFSRFRAGLKVFNRNLRHHYGIRLNWHACSGYCLARQIKFGEVRPIRGQAYRSLSQASPLVHLIIPSGDAQISRRTSLILHVQREI